MVIGDLQHGRSAVGNNHGVGTVGNGGATGRIPVVRDLPRSLDDLLFVRRLVGVARNKPTESEVICPNVSGTRSAVRIQDKGGDVRVLIVKLSIRRGESRCLNGTMIECREILRQ